MRFTHALEGLLHLLRDGVMSLEAPLADLLLRATDVLRALVDATRAGDEPPEATEAMLAELVRAMPHAHESRGPGPRRGRGCRARPARRAAGGRPCFAHRARRVRAWPAAVPAGHGSAPGRTRPRRAGRLRRGRPRYVGNTGPRRPRRRDVPPRVVDHDGDRPLRGRAPRRLRVRRGHQPHRGHLAPCRRRRRLRAADPRPDRRARGSPARGSGSLGPRDDRRASGPRCPRRALHRSRRHVQDRQARSI